MASSSPCAAPGAAHERLRDRVEKKKPCLCVCESSLVSRAISRPLLFRGFSPLPSRLCRQPLRARLSSRLLVSPSPEMKTERASRRKVCLSHYAEAPGDREGDGEEPTQGKKEPVASSSFRDCERTSRHNRESRSRQRTSPSAAVKCQDTDNRDKTRFSLRYVNAQTEPRGSEEDLEEEWVFTSFVLQRLSEVYAAARNEGWRATDDDNAAIPAYGFSEGRRRATQEDEEEKDEEPEIPEEEGGTAEGEDEESGGNDEDQCGLVRRFCSFESSKLSCLLDLALGYAYSSSLLMYSPSSSSESPWTGRRPSAFRRSPSASFAKGGVASLSLPVLPHCAPFTLLPSPFPLHLFVKVCHLTKAFNRIVDRLTCVPRLLLFLLAETIKVDSFTRNLCAIAERVYVQPQSQAVLDCMHAEQQSRASRAPTPQRGRASPGCGEAGSHGAEDEATARNGEARGDFALKPGERRRENGAQETEKRGPAPPKRDIGRDIRLHILRSDYMLDRPTVEEDGDREDEEGDREDEEGDREDEEGNKEEGERARKNTEFAWQSNGGRVRGRRGDNRNPPPRAPAGRRLEREETLGSRQKSERRKRELSIKQVEINTIAASFAGLASKVSSLHQVLVLAAASLPPSSSSSSSRFPSSSPCRDHLIPFSPHPVSEVRTPASLRPAERGSQRKALPGVAEVRRLVASHLCLDNHPVEQLAAGLAEAHFAYLRRTLGEEKGAGVSRERVAKEAPLWHPRRAALASPFGHPVFLLCVTLGEEGNEVDQRLLQAELMSKFGVYMLSVSIADLLRSWKDGDVVILGQQRRQDEGAQTEAAPGTVDGAVGSATRPASRETQGAKERFFDFSSGPEVPAGRLLLLSSSRENAFERGLQTTKAPARKEPRVHPRTTRKRRFRDSTPREVETEESEGAAEGAADEPAAGGRARGACEPVEAEARDGERDRRTGSRSQTEEERRPPVCPFCRACQSRIYAEISVIYYRSMYSPNHYEDAGVWGLREFLEASDAVKVPTVLAQLAGTKTVQQRFSDMHAPLHFVPASLLPPADSELHMKRKDEPQSRDAGGGDWESEEAKNGRLWLLRYLVPDDRTRQEMQQVFQLQVDPCEAWPSSHASCPASLASSATPGASSTPPLSSSASPPFSPFRTCSVSSACALPFSAATSGESVAVLRSSAPSRALAHRRRLSRRALAAALSLRGSRDFLLKPQREGGGNNLHGEEMQQLLRSGSEENLRHFVLMKKMQPPSVTAIFVRAEVDARGGRRELKTKAKQETQETETGEVPGGISKGKDSFESEPRALEGERNNGGGRLVCTFQRGIQELGLFGVMLVTGWPSFGSSDGMDKENNEDSEAHGSSLYPSQTSHTSTAVACFPSLSSSSPSSPSTYPAFLSSSSPSSVSSRGDLSPSSSPETVPASRGSRAVLGEASPASYVEFVNCLAGWMIRTKSKKSEEGGVAAGFGVLDSPLLLPEAFAEQARRGSV
ncbi:eukaryotic glutathione synthase, atp binding domain-containing protein [Toxoplasma gondii ARI]|uniref:Eukaryotic glutathione synthase, atp binding domain-containing protein n=1 Tax=Toxoplasma gondii ARI TaxID=1074872 RepID=A0A139XX83_TOXGO|nr:eukaryotic glutathione synthase, atp binding domain-containing protein [Toxoplasma gondii ARI]